MIFKKPKPHAREQVRQHYIDEINQRLQNHNTPTIAQIHYIIQHATPKDITRIHNAVQKATKNRCTTPTSP